MGKSSLDSRLLSDGVAVYSVSSVPLGHSEDSLVLSPTSVSFWLSFVFIQCSVVS